MNKDLHDRMKEKRAETERKFCFLAIQCITVAATQFCAGTVIRAAMKWPISEKELVGYSH